MLSRGGKRTSIPPKPVIVHANQTDHTYDEHEFYHHHHDTHGGYVQVSQAKPQRRGISVSRDFSVNEYEVQEQQPPQQPQHYISCSNSSSSYGYGHPPQAHPEELEDPYHHGYYQPNYVQEYSPSQSSSSGPEYLGEDPPCGGGSIPMMEGDPMSLEETIQMWEMSAQAMHQDVRRHTGSVGANGYMLAMSSDVYLPEEEVG